MTAAGTCPDLPALEAFAVGACAEHGVADHVGACPGCAAAVETARRNNAFLAGVRTVLAAQETPDRAPAAQDPIIRDLVSGYEILDEINRGGQAVVYRALQVQTRRVVAMKMLLAGRGGSDRERFEREARIAAGLRHPNIVTVHDSVLLPGGRLAFVMEHIDGQPLDCWSARLARARGDRRSAMRERLAVMARVCDAVLYAHQRAIVHRDLKPANIMVDGTGDPHILDFGIARDLGPEERTRLTHTGAFTGTLAYASPEQVSGDPSRVDTRTDIYSLGVIMYELVSGRMPYAVAGAMGTTVRNIETAEPTPLSRRTRDGGGPFVDDEVSTIILKAMAKDPARRYQTAAGLGNDIKRYLAGEAIEARRDSTWYVLRKFARRHRWLLAAASVTLLTLIAGGVATGYGLLRAKDERQQKELESARAEAEALASQASARLIQQTLLPLENPDDALLGHRVRTGLGRLQKQVEFGAFAGDAREDAAARKLISSVYLAPHLQAEAEVHLRQSIAAIRHKYGDSHVLLAQALHDLAVVLEKRGRNTEAERWVGQSIEKRRRLSGPDDPALAASHHLLARLLVERGDTGGADAACSEAMRLYRRQQSPNTSDLAWVRLTQSRIRDKQGRMEEAEAAAHEALIAILISLSDEDPLLPQCLRRTAEVNSGRPQASADPRLAAALQAPSRAQVAQALSAAATNLESREDTVADRRRHSAGLEVVLALKHAYLGENHIACAGTLALIGDDRHSIHDLTGEAAATERTITLLEASLGRHHPALIQPYELIWYYSLRTEDLSRAIAVRRRMLAIWEVQPEEARDELWIANEHRWLAVTLVLGGEFFEAEREFRACLHHLTAGGLADHYLGDICTGGLGWVAVRLGRPEEAEALTRRALSNYAARAGAPWDQLAMLQSYVAEVLVARGKLDEARPYIQAAVKSLFTVMGEVDCRTWRVLTVAIELAERTGDNTEADRLRALLADSRRTTLAPPPP